MYKLKDKKYFVKLSDLGFKDSIGAYTRKAKIGQDFEFLEISENSLVGSYATITDIYDLVRVNIVEREEEEHENQ